MIQSSIIQMFGLTDRNNEKNNEFIPDYFVYTDGACSNNGRTNALAGIGIFLGHDDPRNVFEIVEGKQSNNTAELTAIIKTWPIIKHDVLSGKKITIVSDSIYAIRCVSSYGEKCAQNFWNKEIPNKELVRVAYEIYKDNKNVEFTHIKAHTNKQDVHSLGNDGADMLANKAIGVESCPYDKPDKIYLTVPFAKKEEVKSMGGKWDAKKKRWFIYGNNPEKDTILSNYS
jgi:ribonuclease HI